MSTEIDQLRQEAEALKNQIRVNILIITECFLFYIKMINLEFILKIKKRMLAKQLVTQLFYKVHNHSNRSDEYKCARDALFEVIWPKSTPCIGVPTHAISSRPRKMANLSSGIHIRLIKCTPFRFDHLGYPILSILLS